MATHETQEFEMARPKIGIFSALFAVGGVLAWRWVQSRRSAQPPLARDLTRWEDEGGAVRPPAQPVAAVQAGTSAHRLNGNGADHAASGEPWPFPRS
jgi:hypothetical protein